MGRPVYCLVSRICGVVLIMQIKYANNCHNCRYDCARICVCDATLGGEGGGLASHCQLMLQMGDWVRERDFV